MAFRWPIIMTSLSEGFCRLCTVLDSFTHNRSSRTRAHVYIIITGAFMLKSSLYSVRISLNNCMQQHISKLHRPYGASILQRFLFKTYLCPCFSFHRLSCFLFVWCATFSFSLFSPTFLSLKQGEKLLKKKVVSFF
jgi:hypothetical protein